MYSNFWSGGNFEICSFSILGNCKLMLSKDIEALIVPSEVMGAAVLPMEIEVPLITGLAVFLLSPGP